MKSRNHNQTVHVAISAILILSATSAIADMQTLTAPTPSEFVDGESSIVVPFPTDQGRQVALTLSAPFSPTNAIQVALGQDTNGDEDLEPEETALVLGVDCLVPFAREEKVEKVGGGGQWNCLPPFSNSNSNSNSTFIFSFKQPQKVADRFTHAKVTTRNMATTNAVIVADIKRPGLVLLLR